jgi:hypothetical protein
MKNILSIMALLLCFHQTQAQDTSYISLEKLLQQVENQLPFHHSISIQHSIYSGKSRRRKILDAPNLFNRHHAFPLQLFHAQ